MTTRLAIHGAAGRMGRRLVALGSADKGLKVVAALENASHPDLGKDAGALAGIGNIGVPLAAKLVGDVDAVIDFSIPEATDEIVELCASRGIALVMATTGHSDVQKEHLRAAAKKIPLVWAPSMSMAVNVTMKLVADAARALKGNASGVDVEILERHHRFKEDSPSGTALKFGEIVAREMDITGVTHGREGRPGARPRNEIGYHAIRTGDNPGEHTIVFGMLGETLELTVRASNRDCYALGALAAAKFVAGKPVGLYTMNDVLGL
jgi:4-hydroxy-tetrahydrodipicolinate reductase